MKDNDETGVSLKAIVPSYPGFSFLGWFEGNAETATDSVTGATIGGNKTFTAKWAPLFSAVPEGNENVFTEEEYKEDGDNSALADAGYYKEGEDVKYVISVTTAISSSLSEKSITRYGFYVYNMANNKHAVAANDAAIAAGEKFYAKVTGIPETAKTTKVYFKPFATDGTEIFWGQGYELSVDALGGNKEVAK